MGAYVTNCAICAVLVKFIADLLGPPTQINQSRSGSTYAYSVLDEGYREGMPLLEAAALARRAVRHATYRDAFSGESCAGWLVLCWVSYV